MIINWANTDVIVKESTVVLLNRTTRNWLEIDKKTYDFLLNNYHYTKQMLIKKICTKQNELPKDAIYFVDKMMEYGFMSNEDIIEKRIVSLYITNVCNLYCKYCYRSASSDNDGFLNVTKISEIFDKLALNFGCRTLVVTGGEPLLHPDIYCILKQARKYFSTVILQTNGTLINDQNVLLIKENVDRIRIGLDGSNSEVNDLIRGKGSFERILHGIKCVRDNDIPLTISTTLYDINVDDMANVESLVNSLGSDIVFTDFMPLGRGEGHFEQVMINKKTNANNSTDIRCGAFSKKFAIDHNGNVYPCDELIHPDFLIGNILELDENNIYDNNLIKVLVNRNIYTLGKCTSCQYRYNCNALCPAKVYRERGTISSTDIYCEQVHE